MPVANRYFSFTRHKILTSRFDYHFKSSRKPHTSRQSQESHFNLSHHKDTMISPLTPLTPLIAALAAVSPVTVTPPVGSKAGKYVKVQCRGMHHYSPFWSRDSLTFSRHRKNLTYTPQNSKTPLSKGSRIAPMLPKNESVRVMPFSNRRTDTNNS